MPQSALYSEKHAKAANLSLSDLGISSWGKAQVKTIQSQVKAAEDGWLGPKTIKAWKNWRRCRTPKHTPQADLAGQVIIDGKGYQPPPGVTVVNHLEVRGIPAQLEDTSARKRAVTQLVIHRGAERTSMRHDKGNYAVTTERVLSDRGLSTTFSQDIDGVIYQHFDPAIRRGRHATHHNVQSDSIDIGGPLTQNRKPEEGQKKLTLKMAIGRTRDKTPPLKRREGIVRCWTMPEAQVSSLAAFLPWYCGLRGIPVRACEDWRVFRVSGLGRMDPVTHVRGILAHTQISEPGRRVDGILPLHHLKEVGADIEWRSGADFFA